MFHWWNSNHTTDIYICDANLFSVTSRSHKTNGDSPLSPRWGEKYIMHSLHKAKTRLHYDKECFAKSVYEVKYFEKTMYKILTLRDSLNEKDERPNYIIHILKTAVRLLSKLTSRQREQYDYNSFLLWYSSNVTASSLQTKNQYYWGLARWASLDAQDLSSNKSVLILY